MINKKNMSKGGGYRLLVIVSIVMLLFAGISIFSSATTHGQSPVADGTVFAATGSGSWSGGTWTLDSNGLLTISGSGSMGNSNINDKWWNTSTYRSSIQTVVIQNGVTSIGKKAFTRCTSLSEITILSSVTSIDVSAFEGCTSLSEITIPSSVTSISSDAFFDCTSLSSINVDSNNNSYKDIEGVLFTKNGLTLVRYPEGKSDSSYTIPNSVTSIGNHAFSGCTSLSEITIPSSVTSIGDSAFYGCTSLSEITIPNSVTSICNTAFGSCTNLTDVNNDPAVSGYHSVTLPASLQSLGEDAFNGCNAITRVDILGGATVLGYGVFEYCESLGSVVVWNSEVLNQTHDIYPFYMGDLIGRTINLYVPDEYIDNFMQLPWYDEMIETADLSDADDWEELSSHVLHVYGKSALETPTGNTGVIADIVVPTILAVTIATVTVMYVVTFKKKKRI